MGGENREEGTGATGGNPPNEPGAGGGSENGGSGAGDGGTPPATVGLNAEVLPDFLRDKSEREIKFYLNQAFSSLETQQDQIRSLRHQLEESETTSRREEPPTPPENDTPLEELILTDADAALTKWMRKRGLVDRFDSLEGRVGDLAFSDLRGEFPDLRKYEKEIKKTLRDSGAPVNQNTILGVYKMLKGEEYLEQQRENARSAASSTPPTPPSGDEGNKKPQISDMERTFATAQGMTEEEWIQHRDNEMSIKLPT